MHLQQQAGKGVQRRSNCKVDCSQPSSERKQPPGWKAIRDTKLQADPTTQINKERNQECNGRADRDRPGTKNRICWVVHASASIAAISILRFTFCALSSC